MVMGSVINARYGVNGGKMNSFPVKDLKNDAHFDKPVFLDPMYILMDPEVTVYPSLSRCLIQWEFRELLCDGEQIEPGQEEEALTVEEEGTESPEAKPAQAIPGLDGETARRVQDFYQRFTQFVDQVFTRYVTKNELNINDISNKVKELNDFIRENRRYVLGIQDLGAANRNYLVSHSVKSTILSLVMGSYMKLQPFKQIELGVAALLHEIGMVRLPPQLYMTDRPLSPPEKKSIFTHPVLGYNILRGFSFPLPVCLAALEHHERNNGQGYPRNLVGDKISPYAKIIAIACSYDAVTSARPYKNAKDGYAGMLDMLKNDGKQYEENAIRALVYSLSLFPIGSFVLLSDERPALVVESNAENPRFPLVGIINPRSLTVEGNPIQTKPSGPFIKRILSKTEAANLKAT